MKIKLILTGKTSEQYLQTAIDIYLNRLKNYVNFEIEIINDLKNTKNLDKNTIKKKEAEEIFKRIEKSDFVVLLDENGKHLSSVEYAKYLQKRMLSSLKTLAFVVGGAYGFDDAVYKRANSKLSLSKMTFSHQMIRPFFLEQTYRAFTILKNEPYHNE